MTAGRVLCVTSNFPRWVGGSTTPFVLHPAQDLQALGWQVDVLAPLAPDAAQSETLGGVRVARFRDIFGLRGRLMSHFKRAARRGADAMTVNSSTTGQAVLETAGTLPRLDRIPMGVAVDAPNARQQALAAGC